MPRFDEERKKETKGEKKERNQGREERKKPRERRKKEKNAVFFLLLLSPPFPFIGFRENKMSGCVASRKVRSLFLPLFQSSSFIRFFLVLRLCFALLNEEISSFTKQLSV